MATLTPAPFPTFLPGDVLLYSRTTLFNRIIQVKTWSRFTHVEVIGVARTGHLIAYASRNGIGVGAYPFDPAGLALVLRPIVPCGGSLHLDANLARPWFYREAVGQRYDWLGLLNFTYARWVGRDNHAMFCSEFVTRYLRRAGFDPFPGNDADTIAPRDFSLCPCLRVMWRSADEQHRLETEVVV